MPGKDLGQARCATPSRARHLPRPDPDVPGWAGWVEACRRDSNPDSRWPGYGLHVGIALESLKAAPLHLQRADLSILGLYGESRGSAPAS